ncbi:transposase for insertion sequence element IS905 [Acidiphilium sp. JA12-A1]|nr:transposase for insertion sequence element IS905 [Acidiphilium sp. JA12-A1]
MRRVVTGLFDTLRAPGAGLLQAVAFAVHLQDLDVVRETVEQRTGQPFGAKDARPILEGQVRGDDGRAALVPLAEYLEQQFCTGLRQRHVTQFIDDQEFETGKLRLQSQQTALVPCLHQLVHQASRRHEPHGLDRKATNISLLVVLGVRRDGQKLLLAVKNMGGESEAAWRAVLDDLIARGLRTPELLLIDGGAGLERALACLWPEVPTQRCTVHKHRNLLAHAPEALHEEITADYNDMIYAETSAEVMRRRRLFLVKWRLKCRGVADSLEEAGDRLFTFTRLPQSQWKSARTTNAIERLHEEFKRRIKTQTVLPSAETAAMLFWSLLASGQITMRKVDGWQSLGEPPASMHLDLVA